MDLPAPTGNRPFVITDEDHRGSLWVVSIICCVYVVLILALRSSARRNTFGPDDWLAVASTVTGLVQYVMIFVATSNGLGRTFSDISPSKAQTIGKVVIASNILLFLTLFLGKATVIYLCRRLFASNMKARLYLCDATAGLCAIWCIASIITTVLDCGPLGQIGYRTDFCPNMVARWMGIGLVDAITEALIVALATFIIWPLQMTWKRKAVVIMSFAPRLILAIFIALHITTLKKARDHTSTRGVALTKPEIYLQAQLLYSILSAAIPALNRWLRKFDTGMGEWAATTAYGSATGSGSGKARRTRTNNIPMKSMRFSSKKSLTSNRRSLEADDRPQEAFRPDAVNYSTTTNHHVDTDAQSGQSRESVNSQANIIRKDTQWNVRYEDAPVTSRQTFFTT